MNNKDLAHRFFYNYGSSGKGSNLFFENNVIYSYGYHFPICRIIEKDGQEYYLFTLRGYSKTTAKHISYVRSAIPNMNRVIWCFDIPSNMDNNTAHRANIDKWKENIVTILQKKQTARKPEKYDIQAAGELGQLHKYCDFFGIDIPENLKELNNESLNQYIAEKTEKERIERERYEKANKERIEREILRFRNYESNYCGGLCFDLLRISQDGLTVETSRNISVDKRVVKILWCMLQSGKDITGRHCGVYTVNSITEKTIQVGCHTFERTEVLSLINQIP